MVVQGTPIEPYRNFRFLVSIDGFASAGFNKVTGLKLATEVIEYREGGENTTTRKFPGQAKFEPIILERGMTENLDMWNWATAHFNTNGGGYLTPKRKSLTIQVIGRDDAVLRSWTAERAWCSEWEAGEFDAKGNEVLLEKITFQHEGLTPVETTPTADTVSPT